MVSGVIGSEFLPHLDEGAIWVYCESLSRPKDSGARRSPLFSDLTASVSCADTFGGNIFT